MSLKRNKILVFTLVAFFSLYKETSSFCPVPFPIPIPAPAVIVAVAVAVAVGIEAAECLPPAFALEGKFESGIQISSICDGTILQDAENALSGCCNGTTGKTLLKDVAGIIHKQQILDNSCKVLGSGGVEFLKGFCGKPGDANWQDVYSCGANIKAIQPYISDINSLMSGNTTLPSNVCTALQSALSGSSCCNSNVGDLMGYINTMTNGSLNSTITQRNQLCQNYNGQLLLDFIAGLDCNS